MTIDAIASTLAALADVNFEWSVTVVDNDSGDGSEEKIKIHCQNQQQIDSLWKKVEVLQSGNNGGFGAGNNIGIRHAMMKYDDLEYIYILNSDAFPATDALIPLVSFLDANSEYGFAGSYIHGVDNEPHNTAFRFPTIQSEFEGAINLGLITRLFKNNVVPMGIPKSSIDVNWLAGASMMMRVEMIHQIGVFDETFFLYFEETDLFLRASRKGWKARYMLESRVAHVGSASTGMKKWDRIPEYWLDSRKHYFTKNHGHFYFAVATLAKLIGRSVWKLRCMLTSKKDSEPKNFGRDMLKHALKN
jgi:GT2 family glycosyltransferase